MTRWRALSIVFVSHAELLGHVLVGDALEVEAEGLRLELREAGAEREDEALQLLGRDDDDRRLVDARARERVAERAVARPSPVRRASG